MAINVSELNKKDIYYRSYSSGETGKCLFIRKENHPEFGESYIFRFIATNHTIRTTRKVLEKTRIYHLVKRIQPKEINIPLSW